MDITRFVLLEILAGGSAIVVIDSHHGIKMQLPAWALWMPTNGCRELLDVYHDLDYRVMALSEHRELIVLYGYFKETLNTSGLVNDWFWDWTEVGGACDFVAPTIADFSSSTSSSTSS